jgi:hypothetical protein
MRARLTDLLGALAAIALMGAAGSVLSAWGFVLP